MLIIFDLDDTLIDTFGCSQPVKFRVALLKMVEAGLTVSSVDSAYKRLMRINDTSPNGRTTMALFLKSIGAPDSFLSLGLEAYYAGEQLDFPIVPLEGAVHLLNTLQKNHDLVLISHNPTEEEQYGKMKKAGISPTLFRKILITPEYDKKKYYLQVAEELGYPPVHVLVVGDKYKTDLLPAKKLGMKTVYIGWGRGKINPPAANEVDYSISRLSELLNIVEKLS